VDAEVLKSVPFFSEFDEAELREVATWATELSVPEGKELVREGDYSYDLYVIEDGTATVTQGGQEIAELGPGDFFGEAGVLQSTLRSATVTAGSRVRVIAIDHWSLDRLKQSAPQVVSHLEQVMKDRQPVAEQ
jgi:CRP/FNR family cyclic AMP-dependent transcriptional regulator